MQVRWWTVPAIMITVLAIFAWGYYPVVRVQYRETRERARLSAELQSIKERNNRLLTQVERLKTPEGVEDYARSQLGLVKKGEHKVVVVADDAKTSEPSDGRPRIDSDETTDSPAGPWTAFLDLVFGVE
jgi:cell division protein FtsB